jgi:CRISPR-associated endoribonuclease Cas6
MRGLRVLVRLRAEGTFPYELAYHHHFQGFIYAQIRGTKYAELHDRQGSKFFSFSNLIPPSPIVKEGSRLSLVIASPDEHFIETLVERLRQSSGKTARIAEMIFTLKGVDQFHVELPHDDLREFTLTSGTPIVVRIPRYSYKQYGIAPKRNYEYAYWRKEYTPTAFIRQLEDNLGKKYAEYSSKHFPTERTFEKLRFKKQVAVPLLMKGRESTVIGTLWEFSIQALNGQKREILQFALDAGFGEMNSLGFGFMNLTTKPEVASN